MQEINFEDLEFSEIGVWPLPLRIGVVALSCIALLGIGYIYFIKPKLEMIESNTKVEDKLRKKYQEQYRQVSNLPLYEKQLDEVNNRLDRLIEQLPLDDHVPSLIKDIAYQAQSSFLSSKYIRIGKYVEGKFYKEIPLDIKMVGKYHDIGAFASNIAKMPRIVTLHDFSLKNVSQPGMNLKVTGVLEFIVKAKTYRYIDAKQENKQE